MDMFPGPFIRLFPRILGRSPTRRRGTILLLALASLAIISIAALAYVTVVRVDRSSAAAVTRTQGYQRQANAVVEGIKSLLAADLFGNKIVTTATPRSISAAGRRFDVWPRPFEDGESWDLPFVVADDGATTISVASGAPLERETYTFNRLDAFSLTNPPQHALVDFAPSDDDTKPRVFRAALPDDAWLASYDPIWNLTNPDMTLSWRQITNLRSGFTFVRDVNGDNRVEANEVPQWHRGDGRFADLSQFFRNPTTDGFADPGAQLLTLTPDYGTNDVRPNDPDYTGVFQFTMANIGQQLDSGDLATTISPIDQAQWMDTDGDNRPDARWTQLDVLGTLGGLVWVVAPRIIDLSALVNVNSSIEFAYPTLGPDIASTGQTPADIDLFRLLRSPGTSYTGQVSDSQLVAAAFRQHIEQGLGVRDLVTELAEPSRPPSEASMPPYVAWAPGTRLNARHREAFWRYVGSTPTRPGYSRGSAYPQRDLIDLMAFAGTNNSSLISKIEETIDGPEGTGFLPSDPGTGLGPLRAREDARSARDLSQFPQRPTRAEIRDTVRRYLTTVSGSAITSPVPNLTTTPDLAGVTRGAILDKIGLRELAELDPSMQRDQLTRAPLIQRMFGDLVWALAPLATEPPIAPPFDQIPLTERNRLRSMENGAHYGGGTNGPAQAVLDVTSSGVLPGAAFAVLTAASLAVNITDAVDSGGADVPTVLRFFPTIPDSASAPYARDNPQTVMVETGTAFAHGSIAANPSILPSRYVGEVSPTGGITVVGVERQPFLSEVTTYVGYTDCDDDALAGPTEDRTIDPASASDVLGSAIMIEVVNPWPQEVSLVGFKAVIPANAAALSPGVDLEIDLAASGVPALAPGERRVFIYIHTGASRSWPDIDELTGGLPAAAGNELSYVSVIDTDVVGAPTDSPDMFSGLAGGERLPALLIRDIPANTDGSGTMRVVVDRMLPPSDGSTGGGPTGGTPGAGSRMRPAHFPARLNSTYQMGQAGHADVPLIDNTGAGPLSTVEGQAGYFIDLGYADPVMDARFNSNRFVGRLLISSSLTRPSARPSTGGFPSTVLEFVDGVRNELRNRYHAQVWLARDAMLADPLAVDSLRLGGPETLFAGPAPVAVTYPLDFCSHGTIGKQADLSAINAGSPLQDRLHGFQLFCPDGPLFATAEIGMVSTYAHTCIGTDLNNLANWFTVGEKLARSVQIDYEVNADGSIVAGRQNPAMGVLDLSRYTLVSTQSVEDTAMLALSGLPDSLAVPLGTRVFDLFDAGADVGRMKSANQRLTQGRVNVNTAPRKVLQILPFVSPELQIGTLVADPTGQFRLDWLADYLEPPTESQLPSGLTELPGLRQGSYTGKGTSRLTRGLTNTGELAVMDRWQQVVGGDEDMQLLMPMPSKPGFAYLGGNTGQDNPKPLDLRAAPPVMLGEMADSDPIDDAEERLAIYRGLSDVVTTRSDVYAAWFVIRGYDPKVIEGIRVDGRTWQEAMNDPAFRPAHESRWFTILDRSNVRLPTDRPRVIMLVEMPGTGN